MVRPKPFFLLLVGAISMLHCHAGEGERTGEVRPELPGLDLEPTDVWSGDYTADSLRIIDLYELYDYYEDRRLFDSAVQVCREMIQLGGPLLEFRYDSSLYEKYAKALGVSLGIM
ncbi:MAG: hypothetical protein IPL49_15450 [Saprospirales bacterium]|nr:hypothetical protein [Saprospirales bacterium]